MIDEILPAKVAVAERWDDPPEATLLPEEEPVVARAVDKRRREFTTVRYCARLALAELGVPPAPIVPGERGAPRWPPGVVGSMTHCAGYRAAAAAHSSDVISLGIDAEPNGPVPAGVEQAITLPEERAQLRRLAAARPDVHWDRLLFAAKEAVYKTWFPLARRWLGFEDARLSIEPDGTFIATFLVPGPVLAGAELTGLTGRWLARDGLILTTIALLAR
ncbi:MAG TPA: 4'-phosphopantetheinyl transferase superfamily protein [Pseudonocardiaceae bacterium]